MRYIFFLLLATLIFGISLFLLFNGTGIFTFFASLFGISIAAYIFEYKDGYTKCRHGVLSKNICDECKIEMKKIEKEEELLNLSIQKYKNRISSFNENKFQKRVDSLTYKKLMGIRREYIQVNKKNTTNLDLRYSNYTREFNKIYEDYFLKKENSRNKRIEENIKSKKKEKDLREVKLKNAELQLKQYKEKIKLTPEELGKRYERYIGYLYEQEGYKVTYQGIIKKKLDRGIDLVVKNKKETLLIQCKRYGKDTIVRENTINQLFGSLSTFKRTNKNTKTEIKGILITANNNLDENARESLKNFPEITHIAKQYDNNYPLIKCNIGKDDEKIYHLPTDPHYDLVKIEVNKKQFYCENVEEAEKKGFRRRVI